jgi:hypothetical protein
MVSSHSPDRLRTASQMPVRALQDPVFGAWPAWQFQRGVDDSATLGRFLQERFAHSASDLVVPIGSLATRPCGMHRVPLFPRGAVASFGGVAPWLKAGR